MCASPHYRQFCNRDHTKQRWGVGARRMERGCRIKKLESV
ncbi:ABC superfamily (Bind_prot) maltose transport protein [Escherichia coli P12b]|nr:ABC superfamily (Bind_prot) maltose transport protein [Escherichia coli P12b]